MSMKNSIGFIGESNPRPSRLASCATACPPANLWENKKIKTRGSMWLPYVYILVYNNESRLSVFWSCCAMSDTLFVFSFWILSWVVLKRCIKTWVIKLWAWMSSAWLCSWPERYCKCDYSTDRKLIKMFQIRATATNNRHHGLFLKKKKNLTHFRC